jgi:hypothetical protein
MSSISSRQGVDSETVAKGILTRIAVWVADRNLPFLITSIA